jgi:hypothetical protein
MINSKDLGDFWMQQTMKDKTCCAKEKLVGVHEYFKEVCKEEFFAE